MRILYFATHQMFPLTSGNRVRDYHLARELAKRASVTFVEMYRSDEKPSNPPTDCTIQNIVSLRRGRDYTLGKIVRGLAGSVPLTVLNYFDTESASQLRDLLSQRQFDTVQIEGVHLSQYLPFIQAAPNSPSVIVDWHNVESELMWRYSEKQPLGPRRLAARRTATSLERLETELLKIAGTHTVVSERERQKLIKRCPNARVEVIPNGVDTDFYSPSQISKITENVESGGKKRAILFVASMDYHANIDGVTWFAREIWPEVATKHPELEFRIVGRNPPPAVRALASERIGVTGTVEDIRPFYSSAVAVVVPLRIGSGTRLKILEAMAAGVPVVSTHLGAEGIDATNNIHLLVADDRSGIIAAIDKITNSPTRNCLVLAARDYVVNHYNWSLFGERLFQLHQESARRQR